MIRSLDTKAAIASEWRLAADGGRKSLGGLAAMDDRRMVDGGRAHHHGVMMQRGQIVLGRAGRKIALARLSGQREQGNGEGKSRQDFRKKRHFGEAFWIAAQRKSEVVDRLNVVMEG